MSEPLLDDATKRCAEEAIDFHERQRIWFRDSHVGAAPVLASTVLAISWMRQVELEWREIYDRSTGDERTGFEWAIGVCGRHHENPWRILAHMPADKAPISRVRIGEDVVYPEITLMFIGAMPLWAIYWNKLRELRERRDA